jgi:hypothetical protein
MATSLLVVAVGCSKSAANQEPQPATGGNEKVMVPGAYDQAQTMGKAAPAIEGVATGGTDDAFRLKAEEGQLMIHAPADAKAGTEIIAKIMVTPGKGYHVNTEFPIKLTLDATTGVTLAKAKFEAGGHDKALGDAEALDDNQLTIAVKLTPAASGRYTINGSFKFAVCDKDTCLAKKETIAISVAAN